MKTAYEKTIKKYNHEIIVLFNSLQSSVSRARKQLLPALPHSIQAVQVLPEWAKTSSGKQFLLSNDTKNGVTIFSTKKFMELASCETILSDGTFKTAPDPYFQIYTIFGDFENRKIPLVFALLTGKTSDHYKVMLNILKEKMEKIDKVFKADNILSDYVSGFKAAVAKFFPESRHIGCYFHFTQALVKNLRSLDLITAYRFNQKFKEQMRNIFAFAFLPVPLV